MSDKSALPELFTKEPLPWLEWLQAGDHLLCSHMTSEPRALLASLASGKLPDSLSIELGVPFTPDAAQLPQSVTPHVLGGMGAAAAVVKNRKATIDRKEYLDILLSYETGHRKADVVLVSLAEDSDGRLHLGASHGPVLAAARRAKKVIAEINAGAPVIKGSPWPDDIPLTYQYRCHYPIAAASSGHTETKTKAHERLIAEHLGSLIPNGACLQVGIGSLPSAILGLLTQHRHLGIHTGILGEPLYQLITSGAVDNSIKPAGMQQSVTGCVYGTPSLYEAAAQSDNILLASPKHTHSLDVLQQINTLTTINSALEVDLAGRVNAETVKTSAGTRRYVGGVGGLPAFVRGALAARNGMSIIALPSLTQYGKQNGINEKNGETHTGKVPKSRIVKSLEAEVTMDEHMADYVVTEYGVAKLRGASLAQRRQRLMAIASPDAKEWLRR